MVINWTRPAIRDLKDFKEYSLTNTSDYILELTKNVNLLIEQPKLGKIFIYSNPHIIRQFIHKQHRIFYYLDNDTIYILAILHHKQNVTKKINYIKQYLAKNNP